MRPNTAKRSIHLTAQDRVFLTVNGLLLALFFAVELYPLLYVVSASVSDPGSVSSGKMLLFPVKPSLDGYRYLLQYSDIWTGYVNTIFYTLAGTVVNLIVTLSAAYALSRRDLKGRGGLMTFFMVTMYFSGGLIPGYLNIRGLGLLNTPWVMLISGGLSVYNLIVARTFFANTIPWELQEAARIDGANDYRMFLGIILPLSAPIVVVLSLYYGIGHWNSYFSAMIYLAKRRDLWPLQLFLREILVQSRMMETAIVEGAVSPEELAELMKQADTANLIKYCVIIASMLPMLAAYPWLQKFFVKGVMIGAVKG